MLRVGIMMAWNAVVEPDYTPLSDFVTSPDKFVKTLSASEK